MGPLYDIVSSQYASLYVEMRDSTTGDLKTGVAHTDLTVRATTNRGLPAAVTAAAIAAPDAAVGSGRTTLGWVQVDATNCPGLYRADLPDVLFTPTPGTVLDNDSIANAGNGLFVCVLSIKAAGCKTQHVPFQYVANAKNRPVALDTLGLALTGLTNFGPETLGVALRNFLMGYQLYTGSTTAAVPSGTVGPRLNSTGLKGITIEAAGGGFLTLDLQEAIQFLVARLGTREGAGTGTTTCKNPAGTADRIVIDTPGTGDITITSLNLDA